MILIDTTVLVDVLRDASGANAERLLTVLGKEEIAFTRFTELEVLIGARDDTEWKNVRQYLETKAMLEPSASTWSGAARLYFDLRRTGWTVRSVVDCCIAQMAIDEKLMLLHNDRDFEAIASVRPLTHQRLQLDSMLRGRNQE